MAMPPLRPSAGFCLQTESDGKMPGRWYVNVCKHKLVETPLAYSGKVVSREHILSHGIGNMRVPFDLGTLRKLRARAEGGKQTTYCVDTIFNPLIVSLFMDDSFCNALETFRPYVVSLALKRIEESVGVKLLQQKVKLVKGLRYKDGEDDGNLPRELAELPGQEDSFDAELPRAVEKAADAPLIEEVAVRKPAVKKGFLKNADLYGPEGSKEGVLPENAGDPMGWLPKGLRKSCKIVDTNAPDWQEHERKKQAADRANSMDKDFRESLAKDVAAWAKSAQPDKWEADAPEAPRRTEKYDVDYSRFERLPDLPDDKPQEGRDWYCDRAGKCHWKEAAGKPPAAEKEATRQEGAREEVPREEAAKEQRKAAGTGHEIRECLEGLQLLVDVPGLCSMKGVDLDVTEAHVSLGFPAEAKLEALELDLPRKVQPRATRAKFSRKTGQICVMLPCAEA